MSIEIENALKLKDFSLAEQYLRQWETFPGDREKDSGYWFTKIRVAVAQERFSEAADAKQKIDSFLESNLQATAWYYSEWAAHYAKANRLSEVPPVFARMAATVEFQNDPMLKTLPLQKMQKDKASVIAVDGLVAGSRFLKSHRWNYAEQFLRASLNARPDLAVTHLLLARVLRERQRLPEAQKELQMASRLAQGRFATEIATEEATLKKAIRRTSLPER
ncbi:MAG: hypothetical protein OHK0029_31730 [Armatimonadaceae bacterium]